MKLGLNIGSGNDRRQSTEEFRWINVDANPDLEPDICGSVEYMGQWFRQEYRMVDGVDEIVANDILEHVPYNEDDQDRWRKVLKGWVECLRPGGQIRVQVPDPHAIFERFQAGDITEQTMNRVIYGESTNLLDRHYQLITLDRLEQTLREFGLEIVHSEILHVCAIVIGRRPEQSIT